LIAGLRQRQHALKPRLRFVEIAVIDLNPAGPKQALNIVRIKRNRLLISLERALGIAQPRDGAEVAIGGGLLGAAPARGFLLRRLGFEQGNSFRDPAGIQKGQRLLGPWNARRGVSGGRVDCFGDRLLRPGHLRTNACMFQSQLQFGDLGGKFFISVQKRLLRLGHRLPELAPIGSINRIAADNCVAAGGVSLPRLGDIRVAALLFVWLFAFGAKFDESEYRACDRSYPAANPC
jgi:hypothetical protein